MAYWASFLPDHRIPVHVAATHLGICRLSIDTVDKDFTSQVQLQYSSYVWKENPQWPLLREAMRQVSAYFRRELKTFDLPLDLQGTEFQRNVWNALQRIPYGHTRTYAEIAREIGVRKRHEPLAEPTT